MGTMYNQSHSFGVFIYFSLKKIPVNIKKNFDENTGSAGNPFCRFHISWLPLGLSALHAFRAALGLTQPVCRPHAR